MPIYYVIVEIRFDGRYVVNYIRKVIPTTTDEMDKMWRREIATLIDQGINVQGLVFYREPENPLRSIDELEST
jgi:hypothetical protein